ncbi:MAG TPA: hypothetical protein VIC28_03460 [Thermoanaerobaculia bacterium]|jgi:hypothetical protein
MSDESKKTVSKSRAAIHEPYPRERDTFRSLLLSNPNYFGNLKDSPLQAVLPISGNTFYEALGCVGYHPQQERLEAVVYINQPSGYGTDQCGPGTPEYVRFYLSFDSGATWEDQGITSFQAYNIPQGTEGAKRLEYAVSLAVHPERKICWLNPLIQVRAILSWNDPPPPDQPDWPPVWGEVRGATILVEPLRLPPLGKALQDVKLSALLKEVVDLEAPIPTKTKILGAAELAELYKGKDVPVHRFAFKELTAFVAGNTALSAEKLTSSLLTGIQLEPGIFVPLFPETDGDTSYEELKCIGLDPNTPDTLVGVIQVKKTSGYSGGPCTSGSSEYVTFWADFDDNGSFETCLGTAEVRVYDLTEIPREGVYYAVRLPVDLNPYRRDCREPRVVRIRAILSWTNPIPCSDPDKVPTWGNREETLINIAPGAAEPPGRIAILGGIPVSKIHNVSGLTTFDARFATNNIPPDSLGRPCPFGGRVTVQGAPLPLGHSYKVEVMPSGGGAPMAVVTDLWVTDQFGNLNLHTANLVTGRFTYLPFTSNINGLLAQWDSTGDLKWLVRLSTFDAANNLIGTDVHLIQLDNTGPEASIEITAGTGDCGKFPVGTLLTGNFVARDTYLGSYGLGVEPAINPAGVGVPSPSSGLVNTAPAPGDAWSLDTTGMKPCGYVVRVVAVDRAIVDSQSVGHSNPDSAGFCLDAPME